MQHASQLRICRYDVIDSTNTQARRLAGEGDSSPLLIIAREQSAGRGRLGRSFFSPADTGLYMTLLYYPDRSVAELTGLTCAAAWASALAVERLCGISSQIKWVNDLYLGGRKVCGILCESFGTPHGTAIAVGIGINLTTKDFPDALDSIAGSLQSKIDPEVLALRICVSGSDDQIGILLLYAGKTFKHIFQPVLSVGIYRDGELCPGGFQSGFDGSAVTLIALVGNHLESGDILELFQLGNCIVGGTVVDGDDFKVVLLYEVDQFREKQRYILFLIVAWDNYGQFRAHILPFKDFSST